ARVRRSSRGRRSVSLREAAGRWRPCLLSNQRQKTSSIVRIEIIYPCKPMNTTSRRSLGFLHCDKGGFALPTQSRSVLRGQAVWDGNDGSGRGDGADLEHDVRRARRRAPSLQPSAPALLALDPHGAAVPLIRS